MKEHSKEKVFIKKNSDSEKENVSQNKMNIGEQQSNLKQKETKEKDEEPKYSPMSDEIKNFTVQTFATELVTDYKTDPAAKKEMKPIAVEKAKQLEEGNDSEISYITFQRLKPKLKEMKLNLGLRLEMSHLIWQYR